MKLSDYLEERGLKDEDFAALIGVDRTTVSRLRRTGQRPSQQTLEAIVAHTGGKVSANDFWLAGALA